MDASVLDNILMADKDARGHAEDIIKKMN